MPDKAVDINGEEYNKKVTDNYCKIFYIMDIVSTMSIRMYQNIKKSLKAHYLMIYFVHFCNNKQI